jgi:hypothetical protein
MNWSGAQRLLDGLDQFLGSYLRHINRIVTGLLTSLDILRGAVRHFCPVSLFQDFAYIRRLAMRRCNAVGAGSDQDDRPMRASKKHVEVDGV